MAIDRVRVNERSSKVIEFDILDEDNEAVPDSVLTDVRLSLFDLETYVPGSPADGILNSRQDQNVLNANNVTIDSDGHVVWTMQADDNLIVTPRRQVERHRAEFTFTWATGEFYFPCEIEVVNLRRAT